jgi:LPPG:FO 2-phospho-L-lactate transferase
VRCILESNLRYFNHRVTLLAGGVGGARVAQALRAVLEPGLLTVVANVADDTERYGVHISPDPDTILYTLSGTVGPHGWGRKDDTFMVMSQMSKLGVDTSFSVGDKDFALCAHRTARLRSGETLSSITADLTEHFGIGDIALIPASDDPIETWIQTSEGEWIDFQTYFVDRHHESDVTALAYHGAATAAPAPGVIEAINGAEVLVIAPSNPPLSIWPILAIDAVSAAVRSHGNRVGVSPLFGGKPLKGPADAIMAGVGLSAGTAGVLEAYSGMIDVLFVDSADSADVAMSTGSGVQIIPTDTRLDGDRGTSFATELLDRAVR